MSYMPAEQKRRPSVLLSLPSYGNPCPGSVRAAYQYAARNVHLHTAETTASLLAHGFNSAWCAALTAMEDGTQLDYFSMLHSDVEPVPPSRPDEPYWLNVLIDELERTKADVLSCVVPIKDPRGVVSTAVAGDTPWNPLFRLTMQQVMMLPETFSAADLGHPDRALLVNTGCWIARAGKWMYDFPGFTINDRLVRTQVATPEGVKAVWRPEVEPEDWFASRWFANRGMKVLATRKVKVNHVGVMRYGNDGGWGELAFDRDLDAAAAEALTHRLTTRGAEAA